jgi:hypothetical protein
MLLMQLKAIFSVNECSSQPALEFGQNLDTKAPLGRILALPI